MFLFLTCQRTINSLIFSTGVTYWENQIHLWDLIFGSQNSPVWHMFLKYISRANENEFQKTERGFCLQQTSIQKPLSVYTQVSQIWRTKSISEPQFSTVWPIFFVVKDDLSVLQVAFSTSSISPWRFAAAVEDQEYILRYGDWP